MPRLTEEHREPSWLRTWGDDGPLLRGLPAPVPGSASDWQLEWRLRQLRWRPSSAADRCTSVRNARQFSGFVQCFAITLEDRLRSGKSSCVGSPVAPVVVVQTLIFMFLLMR